jgi:hypothetical protein
VCVCARQASSCHPISTNLCSPVWVSHVCYYSLNPWSKTNSMPYWFSFMWFTCGECVKNTMCVPLQHGFDPLMGSLVYVRHCIDFSVGVRAVVIWNRNFRTNFITMSVSNLNIAGKTVTLSDGCIFFTPNLISCTSSW